MSMTMKRIKACLLSVQPTLTHQKVMIGEGERSIFLRRRRKLARDHGRHGFVGKDELPLGVRVTLILLALLLGVTIYSYS